MKTIMLSSFAMLVASLPVPASAQTQGTQRRVTNYSTPGNLKSNHPLDCISSEQVKNIYTPADLLKGVAKCISEDNYKEAVFLYWLAGTYGRFDALRVVDATAHDAFSALLAQDFDSLEENRKTHMGQEIQRTADDKTELASICAKIRGIGPPDYQPEYMIQHGMDAFTGIKGDGLVANFNPTTGWNEALEKAAHCTTTSSR